jgi:hypothetical protein
MGRRELYDRYKFTVEDLEITICQLYYKAIDKECFETCHITISFVVDGDANGIRRIIERMLKNGAGKYVKICE